MSLVGQRFLSSFDVPDTMGYKNALVKSPLRRSSHPHVLSSPDKNFFFKMARLPSLPFAFVILFAFASIAIALSTSHFQTKHQKRAVLGVGRTGLPLPDLFS